jgi:hypothetical protein
MEAYVCDDRRMMLRLLAPLFFTFLLPLPLSARTLERIQRDRDVTVLKVEALPLVIEAIPRGAQRVSLLQLRLSASCTRDVRIAALQVHRFGQGDRADIARVYLLAPSTRGGALGSELREGGRLHRSVRFSSRDGRVLLRPKALVVPACQERIVDVAVDFEEEAAVGGIHELEVERAEDLDTDADKVMGLFPLRNMPGSPLASRATTVTPQAPGNVRITFRPLERVLQVGREQTLASFVVAAEGEKHYLLYSIMLTNDGTARDGDLRNLYLTRHGGRALTSVATQLEDDAVLLTFTSPYFLLRGESITFELRGRPQAAERSVQFSLKEPSDLRAIPSRRARGQF